MLRATVGVPLAGQFAIDDVVATGETTYTLTQGSMEIEIAPLSYKDYTVEDFYNYYGADANTPTNLEKEDTTRLFLFEGPNDELSLVIIHDKPYSNGTGGEATYDFSGLPNAGDWVVKDGPPDSYSRTKCEWEWSYEHTDGGAFRGGLAGTEFIISPQKQGTSNFEALSGSASDPTVTKLDSLEDVGLAPKEINLEDVINQKLDLAKHIDNLNTFGNINEYDRVSDNMNIIRGDVDNGNYRKSDAVDVISRMKYSENLAETSVSVLGPASPPVGEDADTYIGVRSGTKAAEGLNLAQRATIQLFTLGIAGVTVAIRLVRGGRAKRLGKEFISEFIESAVGFSKRIWDILTNLVDGIADFIMEAAGQVNDYIENNNLDKEDAPEAVSYADGLIADADIVEKVEKHLVWLIQGGLLGSDDLASVDTVLERTDDSLMNTVQSRNSPSGSQDAAQRTMNNSLDRIDQHAREGSSLAFDLYEILVSLYATAIFWAIQSGGASLLVAFLITEPIIFAVNAANLWKTTSEMVDITDEYNRSAQAIVRGEEI